MYNFIYFFFFQYFKWRKDDDPKDSAVYGVMASMLFHGFFLLTLFNHLTDTYFLASIFGTNHNKYFWLLFIVPILYLIHKVFKKKSDRILDQYGDKNVLTLGYILVVLTLALVPLIIGILILNSK